MTLFPPSPDLRARRLDSLDSFLRVFDALWPRLQSRFFKYERLQSYEELPGTESWDAFKAGDSDRVAKLMPRSYLKQMPLYRDMLLKRFHYDRIRMVEKPLSDYLRYEFQAYPFNAMFGERVMVIDLNRDRVKAMYEKTLDFMLFDDFGVLINDYGTTGNLQGGWLLDSQASLKPYIDLAESTYLHAVPLGYFLYEGSQEEGGK